MSNRLRSKIGYPSPFDLALSKPLIDNSDPEGATQNDTAGNSDKDGNGGSTEMMKQSMWTINDKNRAAFSNKLSESSYTPPSTDEEQQSLLFHQLTNPSATLGTEIDSALLQERYEESQAITQEMRTISAIHKDLATLVESQQETIDVIEQDAYDIHDRAEKSVGHLQRAKELMKVGMRSEGLMRVFFMVLAVGGVFIALILFLEAL